MKHNESQGQGRALSPPVMEKIGRLISDVHYGEVVITIHDSRIVQLEKREKTRLND